MEQRVLIVESSSIPQQERNVNDAIKTLGEGWVIENATSSLISGASGYKYLVTTILARKD